MHLTRVSGTNTRFPLGKEIVSDPILRKVDITAGTTTGRDLGSIVGSNLASFTAELGGKVRSWSSALVVYRRSFNIRLP